MAEDFELKIEPPKKLSFGFKELWLYRELFYFFTWRDVKVRYKQTALGILWVLIQPILTVTIFTLVMGRALKIPDAGLPYPIFIFSGLLFWNAFSASVTNGGNSMITNAPIIKKIYFPRLIIPLSNILVALVDAAIAFLLFIVMLFIYTVDVNWLYAILLWPLAGILMIIGTAGVSCLLAAMNVKYRDFRYVIPFALQVMLFLTPIIYPASVLGDSIIKYIVALNPMSGVIEIFRYPMLNQLNVVTLMISLSSSFLFLLIGLYYFKSTEHYFADLA